MSTTYRRTQTPDGARVRVRTDDRGFHLSAGSKQHMRSTRTEAYGLLITLASALGVKVTGLPDWAAEAEIEVSDR
ncbi:hypothetical protein [Actinoallomurus sp. CA-142502]|uniref:hypothetical protein n=1 Tax=Actinoallomurus sp. CA-142502 TaxID=3239885 RepID=UPI003D8F6EDD